MHTSPDAVVLLGLVGVLFASEIVHSWLVRGRRVTVTFFGFAWMFFFLKGLVDVPRHADETPFVMNFALLRYQRFNLGIHLLLLPMLRASLAYLAFGTAYAFLRWKRKGDVRFFRLNGCSMVTYCSLGAVVEGVNQATHWWTWKMDVAAHAPGSVYVGYFMLWLVWGVGCFPSVLLNFLDVARPARTWRLGLGYLIGYWTLVIGVSAVAPVLRNPMLFTLAALELGSSLVPGGPRVRGLRR